MDMERTHINDENTHGYTARLVGDRLHLTFFNPRGEYEKVIVPAAVGSRLARDVEYLTSMYFGLKAIHGDDTPSPAEAP